MSIRLPYRLGVAAVVAAAGAATLAAPAHAGDPPPRDRPTEFSAAIAFAQCRAGGPTGADQAIADRVRPQMNGRRLGRAVNAYSISCARVIVETTRNRGLARRAAVIAVTTAITESTLHNYTEAVDHDSLGLFQQRPSQGWGRPDQIVDPVYATNAFLNAMLRLHPNNSWMTGDIGAICQRVQRSAFPDAYPREVHDAELVVANLWSQAGVGASPVTGSVGVVRTGAGLLALYRLAADQLVWGTSQAAPGGAFGAWAPINSGGGNSGYPTALVAGNGAIVVYCRGNDGNIYGASQSGPNTPFGDWFVMGSERPAFRTDPAAVMTASGAIALYATAVDGFVWGASQVAPGGAFGAWQRIGGTGGIASQPQALVAANGGVALYARGVDGRVYGTSQSGPNTGFFDWAVMGSEQPRVTTTPSAVVTPGGAIALYAAADDGHVWGASQATPGGGFGAWQRIGGTAGVGFASRPQPLVAYHGGVALYVRGIDGRIYGTSQSGPNTGFAEWALMGSGQSRYSANPSAIVAANGAVAIYAIATDGTIWGASQSAPGSAFGPWTPIGS